ncbi:MAG: HIT domain-containing protein [Proteobacteria bacterium]|nr:MAG: HIT domain-containing protein [Pseudomonadota bacterium]
MLVNEALVVAQIEVGFRSVFGNEHFAVLMGVHRSGVHVLIIPRQPFEDIIEADDETIGHVLNVASSLGEKMCPDGFRLVTNTGRDAGQSVQHWHVHLLGGRELSWPPG